MGSRLSEGTMPDLERDPETDLLLRERAQTPGFEPTPANWDALREGIRRE